MKDNLFVAELRGTKFVPQYIGYTPENANKFRELLLPDSTAYSAQEIIVPGVNPTAPQYGMSWRLFKKCGNDGDYNIVFLPGKIDIILTKDTKYGDETEVNFCKKCADWFSKIMKEISIPIVTRIAYAPLYAIRYGDGTYDTRWEGLLKKTVYDGTPMRDVNFNFLLKHVIYFYGKEIEMNLLHNISDGIQIKIGAEGQQQQVQVLLLQLDMNSTPEKSINLDAEGVKNFFDGIIEVKEDLIKDVSESI